MLRLAKCCRPVPGDPIVGYISLGRGITIHREDCPNVAVLKKDPERFTPVAWDGDADTAFRVEIEVDGWDRHRLLEDMSRTFAEAGINIIEARCTVNHPMVRNRFVVEVGDTAHARPGDQPAAQHRRRVRRVPRHAGRRLISSRPGCRRWRRSDPSLSGGDTRTRVARAGVLVEQHRLAGRERLDLVRVHDVALDLAGGCRGSCRPPANRGARSCG